MLTIFLYITGAFVLALLAVPLACRMALKVRFIDRPGGRKDHEGAVPPVGGLVIFLIFTLLIWLSGAALSLSGFYAFWLALVLLVATGALDDRLSISPRIKFAAQFAAAILAVTAGQASLPHLGNLFGFGPLGLSWGAVPFAVIAAVLLINAMNLIDGLDGLAGGLGFVALFWLAVCAVLAGLDAYIMPLAILMGALAGFLFFNMRHPLRRRAIIFLGDAGSLMLGLMLAWFSLRIAGEADTRIEPIAIAWILALPIMDTCGQFARRVSEGRHPFSADRHHFHHHFIDSGVPVGRASFIILVLAFTTGLIGVGGMAAGVPVPVLTISWIVLLLAHIYMSMKPERMRGLIALLCRMERS